MAPPTTKYKSRIKTLKKNVVLSDEFKAELRTAVTAYTAKVEADLADAIQKEDKDREKFNRKELKDIDQMVKFYKL